MPDFAPEGCEAKAVSFEGVLRMLQLMRIWLMVMAAVTQVLFLLVVRDVLTWLECECEVV
jgi:hypothetical protein